MQLKVMYFVTLLSMFIMTVRTIKIPRPLKILPKPLKEILHRVKVIQEDDCLKILNTMPRGLSKIAKSFGYPLCVRLEEEKLRKLLGDYNPRYMAATRSEAERFPDLTTNFIDVKIRRVAKKKDNVTNEYIKENQRSKREANSSQESSVGDCLVKGTFIGNSNFLRMCTECPATTQLADNIFPQFINEVLCDDTDLGCFPSVGQCGQGGIFFTFLERTGEFVRSDFLSLILGVEIFIEEWVPFTQTVRTCCQCLANPP